jgi:hypothetical protein
VLKLRPVQLQESVVLSAMAGCRSKVKAMTTLRQTVYDAEYELRFASLFDPGKGFTFPCDERGVVNLDALSERARHNYFYARAVVGREFAPAALLRCAAR